MCRVMGSLQRTEMPEVQTNKPQSGIKHLKSVKMLPRCGFTLGVIAIFFSLHYP